MSDTSHMMLPIIAIAVLYMALCGALGWAWVERSLRLSNVSMYERLLEREQDSWAEAFERINNVQTIGSATVRAAEVAHEDTPEDRVTRQFSEDSIERGVAYLRDNVYASSGMAMPEPELLRAEAISMLGGVIPAPPLTAQLVRD